MRIRDLMEMCRTGMSAAGIDSPAEAEILVSAIAGIPRSKLFVEMDRDAGDRSAALRSLVARRAAGEPLQYILGAWDFYGREFFLTRDTLIPRPETEGLVERVIGALRRSGRTGGRILDVGTGSGAIAVTLAAELTEAAVFASDVSMAALKVARGNASRHGVAGRLRFMCTDATSALKCGDRFDLVVSNPPYVPESDWSLLPREVRDFEPAGALVGGADGLAVLRRIAAEAGRHLAPRGELWCEIGETQGEAVRRLGSGSLKFADVYPDLAGRDRVARWIKD